MKTHILRALVAAAVALLGSTAQAQWDTYRPDRSLWLVGWGLAQPIGDMDKYQSGTSTSGFAMEFRSLVKPAVSVGLAFDFNRFDRTSSLETLTRGFGTLSAPVYRYADQFGIKATGHFYALKGKLRPYLGAGIGVNWGYSYAQTADLAQTDTSFTILLTPEAGLLLDLAAGKTSVAINAAVRYNYTPGSLLNVSDPQWLSEVVGISVAY
jgi:opacity protein-like surface antigen